MPPHPDPRLRRDLIVARVRAIPEGFVRTYGDIDPRAPRLVGRVLASVHDVPWHRVVRADGTIPQGAPQRRAARRGGRPDARRPCRPRRGAAAPGAVAVARTSLSAAIGEVAARDPVLADLVARVGPIDASAARPGRPVRRARPRDRVPAARRARRTGDLRSVRADVGETLTRRDTERRPGRRPADRRPLRATSWPRCATSPPRCSTAHVVLTRTSSRSDDELIAAARHRPRHRPLDRRDVPDVPAAPPRRLARRRPRRPTGLRPRLATRPATDRRRSSNRSASASDPTARSSPATAGRPSRSCAPAAPTRRFASAPFRKSGALSDDRLGVRGKGRREAR